MDTSFSKFITDNGILAASAGITIGFATATFVKSFVADVIMPVIFLAIVAVNKNASGFVAKFLASTNLRFTNFVSELVTWILIVITVFFIINLIRKQLQTTPTAQPATTFANPMLPQTKEHYAPLFFEPTEEEEPVSASAFTDMLASFR
jgi:large-conductance mechanosensitive channel